MREKRKGTKDWGKGYKEARRTASGKKGNAGAMFAMLGLARVPTRRAFCYD